MLAAITTDSKIQFFNGQTGKFQGLINVESEEDNALYALDFNPFKPQIATAGEDAIIRIYDETERKLATRIEKGESDLPGHSQRIFCVKYHENDGNFMISGGWDKTVMMYDARTYKPVGYVFGPYVCGDSLDLQSNYILTGSFKEDKSLQTWDIRTRKLVSTINWNQQQHYGDLEVSCCQYFRNTKNLSIPLEAPVPTPKANDKATV